MFKNHLLIAPHSSVSQRCSLLCHFIAFALKWFISINKYNRLNPKALALSTNIFVAEASVV